MKLNAIGGSAASDPTLRTLVTANMYSTASVLNYMEFYTFSGNADTLRKGVNSTGMGQTRSLDEGYSEKTTTPSFGAIALKILGDQIKTDIAHERRSGDIGSERRRQLEAFGKNLGLFLNDQLINGDGTGENISGIKSLIPESRIVTLGENGMVVPVGTTDTARKAQLTYLKKLVQFIRSIKGGASCLFMNFDMIALLWAIGQTYMTKTNAVDALGNMFEVSAFGGVPIVDTGYKNDGTGLVIPSTETVGTSNDCTSIYAVKFGEKENLTAATNTGLEVVDKGIIGTQYVTMVDFDMNIGLFDDLSVGKFEGTRIEM